MMKNLPNKLLRNKLLEMLDEHCFQVNQRIKEDGGDGHDSILSEFDFLYLPMDFDSGSNLGYAFVNFTSAAAARRLYRAYQNKAWDTVLGSRKICEVTYARIQGLLPLQKRFKNSIFICDSDDYLPVYFTPSRNGDRHCQTEEHFIGRRV
ncbi:Mei2-like C-terminal RNA recognition motif-containing protein, partial [Dioscorea alata]